MQERQQLKEQRSYLLGGLSDKRLHGRAKQQMEAKPAGGVIAISVTPFIHLFNAHKTGGTMDTSPSTFPPVRVCLFDVDGLLINSEDIYTEIYNNTLHSYGKPSLSWSVKARQQSRGTDVCISA